MELQVWEGDWGLPTVDHNCLAVVAFCKFLNAPVDIRIQNNPWKSPSGEFPVLTHAGGIETKVHDIFNFLQSQNPSADANLKPRDNADDIAFKAMIEEKLLPALLYIWWVDTKSYVDFSRPWFSGKLPFPLGLFLPLRRRNEYTAQLEVTQGREQLTDAEREGKLMNDARECLNLLSIRLGDKDFFHGNKPMSFDALVFGYLAPLLNAPLPSAALQNHLKACRNLVQFCQRITDAYFPLSPEEQERNRILAEEARQKLADTTEFPNRRRNMAIAAGVVVAAMLGYALFNGLIQLEFVDVEKKSSVKSPSASVTPVADENESPE